MEAFDRQRRDGLIANISFGVGTAAGVATLGCLLFWPEGERKTASGMSVRPRAAVTTSGGGLFFDGSF